MLKHDITLLHEASQATGARSGPRLIFSFFRIVSGCVPAANIVYIMFASCILITGAVAYVEPAGDHPNMLYSTPHVHHLLSHCPGTVTSIDGSPSAMS